MKSLLKYCPSCCSVWLIIVPILLFFNSCQHNPLPIPAHVPADCPIITVPKDPNLGYYLVDGKDYWFGDAVFNPKNNNEFVFKEAFITSNENWLCTYNIISKQKKVLLKTRAIFYTPIWNAQGWIVFMGTKGEIWKIKENGDSLSQLTNDALEKGKPVCSPDGNKIAFFVTTDSGGVIRIIDIKGNFIKDLDSVGGYYNWAPMANKIATRSYLGIPNVPDGQNIILILIQNNIHCCKSL